MITEVTQALRNELRETIAQRVTLATWMETPVTITTQEQQIEREFGLELARAHIRTMNAHINTLADRIAQTEKHADVTNAERVRAEQVAADL